MVEHPTFAKRDGLANRHQSVYAAQRLLQYIRQRGLRAGDRLPSQSELRKELEFSNDSLSAAMAALVRGGILERKPKVGTIVLDANRIVSGLWRVGVAVLPSVGTQLYYGQLLLALQVKLAVLGSTTAYMHNREASGPSLADFGYLLDDLNEGRLHGALVMSGLPLNEWREWNRRGVPLLHVGSWEGAPCGAVIDQRPMVRQGVELLLSRKIRRIGVVSMSGPSPTYHRFWDSFCETMGAAGLTVDPARDSFFGGEGVLGGARVAKQLLAMPATKRPQGLVVVDDRVAVGLTTVLAEQAEYRPVIVVQTNLQAPVSFALPVIHIELDIEELAGIAVNALLERLVQPELPASVHWVAPRLHDVTEVRCIWPDAREVTSSNRLDVPSASRSKDSHERAIG